MKKKKSNKNEYKRHFRFYFASNHPAFIVDEDNEKYYFHRVTSSRLNGHKKNWRISPNPDISRKSDMYIIKQEEDDNKKRFSKDKLKIQKFDSSFIKRSKKTNKKS